MANGHWTRALGLMRCTSLSCERSMVRDEPIYLVAGALKNAVCAPCAVRRFTKTPPADLPHLRPLVETPTPAPTSRLLPLSDSAEPREGAFARFDRAATSGKLRDAIKSNRKQAAAAAVVDPKLRQLGESDR